MRARSRYYFHLIGRINMNKIKYVSIFFRVLFQILFIALPIMLIIIWTKYNGLFIVKWFSMSYIPGAYIHSISHALSNTDKLLGFCINTIPLAVELFIFYSLIKLFKLYEKGEIFSIRNVHYIRNIGYVLLIKQVIVGAIYEFLMGWALTRSNPPGQRFASVTFGHSDVGIIFAALLIVLISWIMAEGCKLYEEQQLTI